MAAFSFLPALELKLYFPPKAFRPELAPLALLRARVSWVRVLPPLGVEHLGAGSALREVAVLGAARGLLALLDELHLVAAHAGQLAGADRLAVLAPAGPAVADEVRPVVHVVAVGHVPGQLHPQRLDGIGRPLRPRGLVSGGII